MHSREYCNPNIGATLVQSSCQNRADASSGVILPRAMSRLNSFSIIIRCFLTSGNILLSQNSSFQPSGGGAILYRQTGVTALILASSACHAASMSFREKELHSCQCI